MNATDQLRAEIHALRMESDVTVYQVLGVLDVGKADLIEELTHQTKP